MPPAAAAPPVPNFAFELRNYAGRVRALSIVWFIYGGLTLVTGLLGYHFASHFLLGPFGPWAHGPFGPEGMGPALLHFGFGITIVRAALSLVAGWGLMERTQWGRIAAIGAAIFCLLKIPIGTALGIWTLVTLLGFRNSTLYNQV